MDHTLVLSGRQTGRTAKIMELFQAEAKERLDEVGVAAIACALPDREEVKQCFLVGDLTNPVFRQLDLGLKFLQDLLEAAEEDEHVFDWQDTKDWLHKAQMRYTRSERVFAKKLMKKSGADVRAYGISVLRTDDPIVICLCLQLERTGRL